MIKEIFNNYTRDVKNTLRNNGLKFNYVTVFLTNFIVIGGLFSFFFFFLVILPTIF